MNEPFTSALTADFYGPVLLEDELPEGQAPDNYRALLNSPFGSCETIPPLQLAAGVVDELLHQLTV